jgi:hypothetical protein
LGSGFHELHLVTGSRSGHSGLWAPNISEGTDPQNRKYEVSLNTAEEAKVSAETSGKKQRLLKAMEKIETYLAAHGTCGEVESNICEHGKVAADVLQPAIAELLNVGKIEHCEVQRKKTSYPGFRLCQV